MNEEWLIEQFKQLHRHPELGNREYRTTEFLKNILQANGIRTLETGLETGTVAVISGRDGGPVVGLRADIDALPIQEESGLDYASEIPGVMHACGHDFHTACMLGAALLLKEREYELPGTVKIIFQPAEETEFNARFLCRSGLLDDVSVFYAGHTYPWLEPGTLGIRPGPVMASVDQFLIRLKGVGGHAAHPELSVDVIPAVGSLIQSAQSIISRSVSPFDQAVLSITHVESGNTWNVIPEEAMLEGTVRSLNPEVRDRIQKRLEDLTASMESSYGCRAEIEYTRGSDAVINDAAACERAAALARSLGLNVVQQECSMSSEDFSDYLSLAPGAFIRIGTGGQCDAHQPRFTADPKALFPAARFFAELAASELEHPGSVIRR